MIESPQMEPVAEKLLSFTHRNLDDIQPGVKKGKE